MDHAEAEAPRGTAVSLNLVDRYNRSVALLGAGDRQGALAGIRTILVAVPAHADTLHLMGVVHLRAGDPAGAVTLIRRAVACRNSPAFLANLGVALLSAGRPEDAARTLDEATRLAPDDPQHPYNAGIARRARGDTPAALAAFARAGRTGGGYAAGFHMAGLTRLEQNQPEAAIVALRRAVCVHPGYDAAWTLLGVALSRTGRRLEALAAHRAALDLAPASVESAAHAVDIARVSMLFDAIEGLRDQLAHALERALPGGVEPHLLSSVLYRDLYRPLPNALRVAAERQFTAQLAAAGAGAPAVARPVAKERLRLAYLSSNLSNHPIGQVALALPASHDRTRFEVHGFTRGGAAGDPYAARHRAGFDHHHDLTGLTWAQAAERIRQAGIDVLVYLDGHMDKDGLWTMAQRPAPVRVFWLGHAGGIGEACADYLIADRHVVPPGEEGLYGEAVVRVPDCYHCADRHPIGALLSRADYGLPETGIVFCGFNSAEKIDRTVFQVWMRILHEVEGSVLWLSGTGAVPEQADNLRLAARALGIAPDRLVFARRVPAKADHLARHQAADLFLDTWTMNASTTALDALWAGLPIVARHGDRFSNRISTSMLEAVGLGDLVCPDERAYELMAVALAHNPQHLAAIRARLWRNREETPLFDTARFARKMEAAFERMWRVRLAGEPPQGFDLPEWTGFAGHWA